jgi:hypothetical protein
MDTTRSTIVGALMLLVLLGGVFGGRAFLLAQQQTCEARLQRMAPKLAAYARTHHGHLPTTFSLLLQTLGPDVHTVIGLPLTATPTPTRWGTPAVPYLWDAQPHPFTTQVHVLYSDGTVQTLEEMPR